MEEAIKRYEKAQIENNDACFSGNKFMTSFGLLPLSKGYSSDYLDTFDPRVTNEFSTAAFR